jgi:hypothetical protein
MRFLFDETGYNSEKVIIFLRQGKMKELENRG